MQRITFRGIVFLLVVSLGIGVSTANAFDPPVLTGLTYINPLDDYFIFYGWLEHEDPEGCTVVFGDLLWGYSTIPDETGYYYLVVQLGPGQEGVVSAFAYDSYFNISNTKYTYCGY